VSAIVLLMNLKNFFEILSFLNSVQLFKYQVCFSLLLSLNFFLFISIELIIDLSRSLHNSRANKKKVKEGFGREAVEDGKGSHWKWRWTTFPPKQFLISRNTMLRKINFCKARIFISAHIIHWVSCVSCPFLHLSNGFAHYKAPSHGNIQGNFLEHFMRIILCTAMHPV
jgi:hypothetical protein